jgi:hypothetical protein
MYSSELQNLDKVIVSLSPQADDKFVATRYGSRPASSVWFEQFIDGAKEICRWSVLQTSASGS